MAQHRARRQSPKAKRADPLVAAFQPCVGPGIPNATFCGNDNDHYGGYTEPSWINGGSKPVVFPWLSVQTGIQGVARSSSSVVALD